MEKVFELVVKILGKQLDIDSKEIKMETTLEDINADSIDLVEMIMAVEDVYDIEFPEEELENYITVGDLVNALSEYLWQAKNE